MGKLLFFFLSTILNLVGDRARARIGFLHSVFLVVILFAVMDLTFGLVDKYLNFSNLFSLVTLLPGISLSVRRLHDINRSGWWLLLSITLIGLIPLIYWACQRGARVENDYGSDKEAGRDS